MEILDLTEEPSRDTIQTAAGEFEVRSLIDLPLDLRSQLYSAGSLVQGVLAISIQTDPVIGETNRMKDMIEIIDKLIWVLVDCPGEVKAGWSDSQKLAIIKAIFLRDREVRGLDLPVE